VKRRTVATALAGLLTVGCSGVSATSPHQSDLAATPASSITPSVTTATTGSPLATPSPALPSRFEGSVSRLPPDLRAEMHGTNWRRGCPVPLGDLRLLTFRYWGFDGAVHEGPMVVNSSVATDVLWVFRQLFVARFPIKHVALTHRYRPRHDDPNDKRDVTASFNCRPVITTEGPQDVFSQHSYGLAIDVNPLQNPEVALDGYVRGRYSRPYRDRSKDLPGMIHAGDVVVRSFAAIGWSWGGDWSSMKDYMHFSLTGT
jgi:hypothetical protein